MLDLRLLRYFATVVEVGHIGRAASRLHMTQPPLSRAIRQLEAEFGGPLLVRTAHGVTPTTMGTALHHEARELLERAERAGDRVLAAARATLTVGVVADGGDVLGGGVPAAFRDRFPGVGVQIREVDFTDPSGGLRAGSVDVALTRAPFVTEGLSVRTLRVDPVGVVLRADDPLAGRAQVALAELVDRVWCRFAEGTDPLWRAYWYPARPVAGPAEGPVVRTVRECHLATLWTGAVGISPLVHPVAQGLVVVPVPDMPASRLVVARPAGGASREADALVELVERECAQHGTAPAPVR